MSDTITYELTEEKNLVESKEGITGQGTINLETENDKLISNYTKGLTIGNSEYGISYTSQDGFVVKDSDNSSTRLEIDNESRLSLDFGGVVSLRQTEFYAQLMIQSENLQEIKVV